MNPYKPTKVLARFWGDTKYGRVYGVCVHVCEPKRSVLDRISEKDKPLLGKAATGWRCCYVAAPPKLKEKVMDAEEFAHGGYTGWVDEHFGVKLPIGYVLVGWDYNHSLDIDEGKDAVSDLKKAFDFIIK